MIRDLHRVLDLVESGFQRYRVLVVGDLMLDQYLWGDVSRISPEAPGASTAVGAAYACRRRRRQCCNEPGRPGSAGIAGRISGQR